MNSVHCWEMRGDFEFKLDHSIFYFSAVRVRKPFSAEVFRIYKQGNDSTESNACDIAFKMSDLIEIRDDNGRVWPA